MDWFTRVPLGLLKAYLRQLPRIEAEESLLAATRVAVGSGTAKEGSHFIHSWQNVITPQEEVAIEERRRRFHRSVERMTSMGYQLHKVKAGHGVTV